jgi:two-component system, OmpR family, response regulator
MYYYFMSRFFMRLLVVEDEKDLIDALEKGLKQRGYAVDKALDGQEALEKFRISQYDVVLLDLNLPKKDGIEVAKEIRSENTEVGIIMLTARGEIKNRIEGLTTGADDYMPKPFSFDELLARIEALIRRKSIVKDVVLEFGDLLLDPVTRKVAKGQNELVLTNKEFKILEYLLRNQGKAVSAEELFEHVWNENANLFSQTLKAQINNLRRKLDGPVACESIIKTIKNVGYKIGE